MNLVSVITRTKGRPLLLRRAARSLVAQTFRDFEWIVADHSRDDDAVEPALAAVRTAGIPVSLCRVMDAKGMESASNQALARAGGTFVTFLDDDDTWEPEFLAETTAMLAAYPQLGGVCTQTTIVEETADAEPATIRKYVMNADLEALHIADMTVFNHLTTNSLLYRRAVHDTLGAYREDLPVMGDWEFGLRLLAAHDVGVVARPLANYHRRPADAPAAYANTVTAQTRLHAETDARIRNEMLRREWAAGTVGPGHLMALARIALRTDRVNRPRFDEIRSDLKARLGDDLAGTSVLERLAVLEKRLSPRWWLRRLLGQAWSAR